MEWELTAALVVALVVGVWRLVRRPTPRHGEPFPDVGDAPRSAEPVASPRLNDDGLGTYSLDVPTTAGRTPSDKRSID